MGPKCILRDVARTFFSSVSSDIVQSQKRSARKHCVKCKGFLYGWPACKICLLTHSSSPCLLSHAALSSYISQLVILNIHRWLHVGLGSRFLHPSLLSPSSCCLHRHVGMWCPRSKLPIFSSIFLPTQQPPPASLLFLFILTS